jgi:hypothetical protein
VTIMWSDLESKMDRTFSTSNVGGYLDPQGRVFPVVAFWGGPMVIEGLQKFCIETLLCRTCEK